jgi:preprotein translocase subunit SecG
VLTRTTAILAAAFFATSLVLSVIAGMDRKPKSILQNSSAPVSQPVPGAPAAPVTPSTGGGVLDTLRGQPEQPSGPQVPQSR